MKLCKECKINEVKKCYRNNKLIYYKTCSICSGKKASKKLKGRIFSDNHKNKISKALTGRKLSKEHIEKLKAHNKRKANNLNIYNPFRYRNNAGENNSMYGKKHTEETKKKISNSLKGKMAKEKHPMWRGGISKGEYTEKFKNENPVIIFKRDNFKCAVCGNYRGKNGCKRIVRHHIDYNKQNDDYKNLITLCNSCHAKTTNGDREYWKIKLTDIMRGKYEI